MNYRDLTIQHPQGMAIQVLRDVIKLVEPFGCFPIATTGVVEQAEFYTLRIMLDDTFITSMVKGILGKYNIPVIGEEVHA